MQNFDEIFCTQQYFGFCKTFCLLTNISKIQYFAACKMNHVCNRALSVSLIAHSVSRCLAEKEAGIWQYYKSRTEQRVLQ